MTSLIAAALLQGPATGRALIWSDEFSGSGLPDPAKWGYETGKVRNHEDQYYIAFRVENARQEGGNLVIEARKESPPPELISHDYATAPPPVVTSASLTSKAAWKDAYVEVRAKVPTGKGTWPAIWFLGQSHRLKGGPGWPWCGEIDLMENVGWMPDKIHFTVHTGAAHKGDKGHYSRGTNITVPGCWNEFHVYGLDWKRDRLDMYFDGRLVFTYRADPANPNSWPFDKPAYLLLNLAIGGEWGGQKGVDDSIFPARYLVDYVRVYK